MPVVRRSCSWICLSFLPTIEAKGGANVNIVDVLALGA